MHMYGTTLSERFQQSSNIAIPLMPYPFGRVRMHKAKIGRCHICHRIGPAAELNGHRVEWLPDVHVCQQKGGGSGEGTEELLRMFAILPDGQAFLSYLPDSGHAILAFV